MKKYTMRYAIVMIAFLFSFYNFAQQATNKVALAEYFQGKNAMNKGNYNVALNHLNTAVSLIGNKPKLRYQILICHYGLKDFPAVISDGEQMKKMPISTSEWMFKDYTSLYSKAKEKIAKSNVDKSSHERIYANLLKEGEEQFEYGSYKEALEKFKEAKYMEASLELNDARAKLGYTTCKATMDWDKIKTKQSPAALNKFIVDNPTGSLSTRARSKLTELEAKAYVETQEKRTVGVYDKFLSNFPKSKHVKEIKKQRADLKAYSRLRGTETELENYLKNYPNSYQRTLAKSDLRNVYNERIKYYGEKERHHKHTLIATGGSGVVLFLTGSGLLSLEDFDGNGLGVKGWIGAGMMVASAFPLYWFFASLADPPGYTTNKNKYQKKLNSIAFSPIIAPNARQFGFYASIRF